MSLTGEPDGPPARAGLPVVDFSAGLAAALGLVAGLLRARETGVGCDVDVSLLDTAVSMLNYLAAWTLNSDFRPQRLADSSHPTLYPSQVFATSDGHLVIMCAKEKFWQLLVPELEIEGLDGDARFRTFPDRFAHRDDLIPLLKQRFKEETTNYWLTRLRGKVPCAPVNSVEEALEDEQVLARGMVTGVEHPTMGELRMTGNPIHLSGMEKRRDPAPALGADTNAILTEDLGYSAEQIAKLRASGVV
jgi:crotonobetainyl-CoA:carnitine CoA-transferase CaiB-like acyl-CoA transferase